MGEKINFTDESGENIEFFVLEETKISNMSYLLVTESDDSEEETAAYILKDVSGQEDTEAVYEIVEDDDELAYVSKIFSELLDDIDIE